jgi:Kdo2-lipid IVA lauroyltransferase/acyltransferase
MSGRARNSAAELLAALPQALLIGIARILPYRARLSFGGWLLRLAVALLPDLRIRARANLARIYPEKPESERRRIARDMADHLGRTLVETLTMEDFRRRGSWSDPVGPGWEVLQQTLVEGRGVLLVSGHFGQWQAVRAALMARGIEVGALYRPIKNRYLQPFYRRNLEAGGRPLFTRDRAGLRELMRHLKDGGVVAVLTDQYVKRGVPLDFLGHPAPTGTMIAELAVKFGVPVIPVYGTRGPDRRHVRIDFEAPIPPGPPAVMTQAVNDSIGARIRANPEQYLWLHRRWTKRLEV